MRKRLVRGIVFVGVALVLGSSASTVWALEGQTSQANQMALNGTPIRKLGRGLANAAGGWVELPVTIQTVGTEEGPVAGLSLGLLRGIGRTIARTVVGVVEILTFPAPLEKIGYGPMFEPEFLLHP